MSKPDPGCFVPAPCENPTFGNPPFGQASYRVLIFRLSTLRDVDRSVPHLFLFQEVRRALPDSFIDLAFFPSAGERRLLDRENMPYLVGTRSRRPVEAFDLVLISNSYTLELINLPYLFLHAGVPLFAGERGSGWPIVLLGGSNAMASQALVRTDGDSLVDGLFFGEGEGAVGEIVSTLAHSRDQGENRRQALARAAQAVTGLWMSGSFRETRKAILVEPDVQFLPVTYPILNTPEAHEADLQINYGCPAFCTFCFEGYDRRPYRELPLGDLLAAAYQVKYNQGVEELNLYSFNFNTHRDVFPLMLELHKLFDRVSFKSQRADILQATPGLLEAEVAADKREFTLGIEGISQRQRAWLHKSLSEDEIVALLERLLAANVRRIKLFYLLTGYETEDDLADFHRFVRWLKEAGRAGRRHPRVIFSFGLLIRMPFTPLRYDRLLIDDGDEVRWQRLIGRVKSACETNGFEFRLAFDWPTYCASQVLALGGYWLVEGLVELARRGYYFDTTLPARYWEEFRAWMEREAHLTDAFLGEKGPDYVFPFDFVVSNVSESFLYRQYEEAKRCLESGLDRDTGYCLGSGTGEGQLAGCLGCGACADEAQRQAITHHRIEHPVWGTYVAELETIVDRKRHLALVYFRFRLNPRLAGAQPAFQNAFVFRALLARYPELLDNLLSVRESLFSVSPNDRQFPGVIGETIFGLKAWDTGRLLRALADTREHAGPWCDILGPAEGFTPGVFSRLHLDLHLPGADFRASRARLESYLRAAYVPYSLRRKESRLYFDLPEQALKKHLLFGGYFEPYQEAGERGVHLSLDVGPKFDLEALWQTFDEEQIVCRARVEVSEIAW